MSFFNLADLLKATIEMSCQDSSIDEPVQNR